MLSFVRTWNSSFPDLYFVIFSFESKLCYLALNKIQGNEQCTIRFTNRYNYSIEYTALDLQPPHKRKKKTFHNEKTKQTRNYNSFFKQAQV